MSEQTSSNAPLDMLSRIRGNIEKEYDSLSKCISELKYNSTLPEKKRPEMLEQAKRFRTFLEGSLRKYIVLCRARGIEEDQFIRDLAVIYDVYQQTPANTETETKAQSKNQIQRENSASQTYKHTSYDVSIVCALHQPELAKVLSIGANDWQQLPSLAEDPTTYHTTTYTTLRGASLRVVAAAPTQMGLPASAVLAAKMILRFRPSLVAMVGIAAGVKRDQQSFGDILAADYTFDSGSGKIVSKDGTPVFLPDPNPISISPRLRDRLKHWSKDRTELDAIYNLWPGNRPSTALKLHVGPLASVASVIDHKKPIEDIIEHWRKLIGIEMEAYAVHCACRDTIHPQPEFLCLKSICDFAVEKNDGWQTYAAFTAAEFCHRFLISEWEDLQLMRRVEATASASK